MEQGALEQPLDSPVRGFSTTVQAICVVAAAYWGASVSRVVLIATTAMARAVLELVGHLASCPLETGVMLALIGALASYFTDRHTRALQSLAALHPRLLGALLVVQAGGKGGGAAAAEPAAPTWPAPAAAAATAEASCVSPRIAPDKAAGRAPDVASYRIANLGRRRRSNGKRGGGQARWSTESAPSERPSAAGRLQFDPKPRTSVDFDVAAAPTPPNSPERAAAARAHCSADDPTRAPLAAEAAGAGAGAAAGTARRRRRRQPHMQRIASGQELAELGMKSSFEARQPLGPADADAQPTEAAAPRAPLLASISLSSWPPLRLPSAEWVSSTVDTVLRPLLPGLQRAPSAPPSAPAQQVSGQLLEAEAERPLSDLERWRRSFDGMSLRHYSRGGISAHPNRTPALAALAAAARRAAAGVAPGPLAHASVLPGFLAAAGPAEELALGPGAGTSALASLGLDDDCPQDIRDCVTDEHLVQFGALIDEPASRQALEQVHVPGAWQEPGALLGLPDTAKCSEGAWEPLVTASKEGLTYQAWRLPLRHGLYAYRSLAVMEGVAPRDVRPFQLDDHARDLWDDNALEIERLVPPGLERAPRHSEWCLHRYRSRFPRPMAAREYTYARRVWHRPADGGCYAVCRTLAGAAPHLAGAAPHLAAAAAPPPGRGGARSVRVDEYVSACVVRAAPGGGTEIEQVYFEDSNVRAAIANMAVRNGLWPYICRFYDNLRVFAAARQAAEAELNSGAGRRRATTLPGLAAGVAAGIGCAGAAGPDAAGAADEAAALGLEGAYAALQRRVGRLRDRRAGRCGTDGRRAGGGLGLSVGRHLAIAAGLRLLYVLASKKGSTVLRSKLT
eukprot:scaffold4.g4935.t1